MPKLNTFSLYLAKIEATDFDDLLTANTREMVRKGDANKSTSDQFADGSILYTFPGQSSIPKWVALLTTLFWLPKTIFSQSPCALLAFKKGNSIFALTFSYAHVYLDNSKTEADFGLKVVINAVSDKKLRSVERSNIGAAIRDFAQAAGQRDLRSFRFDGALDLIRKVSGYAADTRWAILFRRNLHSLRRSAAWSMPLSRRPSMAEHNKPSDSRLQNSGLLLAELSSTGPQERAE